jgi:hypothetical protein
MIIVKAIIAMATIKGRYLHKMDLNIVFIHGDL